MKCVEMVVTGIEEGTQVVSDVEMKLAEYQDLPDDVDMLEHTHQQLLQIQNIIQDHQVRRLILKFWEFLFIKFENGCPHAALSGRTFWQLLFSQILIDRLLEECRNVRTLVVKSRPSQKIHPDVDKLEEDVRQLRMRWETICTQIVER